MSKILQNASAGSIKTASNTSNPSTSQPSNPSANFSRTPTPIAKLDQAATEQANKNTLAFSRPGTPQPYPNFGKLMNS